LAAVGGAFYFDLQFIGVDIALAKLGDHLEVLGIDVGEGDPDILEFRNGKNVG
jgi:hypothetical protein